MTRASTPSTPSRAKSDARSETKPSVALADALPAKPTPFALLRLAAWGFSAALAIGIAVSVSQTDRGMERLQMAFGTAEPKPSPVDQLAEQTRVTEMETRRLYGQMQALAADRDRLAQRLATLERNFDDVTGSAKSVPTARITQPTKVADPNLPPIISAPTTIAAIPNPSMPANDNVKPGQPTPPPTRAAEAPKVETAKTELKTAEVKTDAKADSKLPPKFADRIDTRNADATVTGAVRNVPLPIARTTEAPQPAAPATAPAQAAEPKQQVASKGAPAEPAKETTISEPFGKNTEFGIDLGGAKSVEGLKGIWLTTKAAHAPLLDNLTPSAVLRPTGKNGAPELRLMAGPFPNAGAAAAICQSFASSRGNCRPFAFDGQKVPLR